LSLAEKRHALVIIGCSLAISPSFSVSENAQYLTFYENHLPKNGKYMMNDQVNAPLVKINPHLIQFL
jgi:hypothetical protein